MKLPTETALLVLGFLRRQTLGRVLLANHRLSGIVNRHRKTLNMPEIPIPPRLSTRLKSLALLAVVTLLLLPIGIVFARRSTQYTHPSASETIVDIVESKLASFKRHFLLWTNLLLALLASVFAVKLLWMDRRIADEYMAATSDPWRDSVLKKHAKLQKLVIGWCIAGFALSGLYVSVALYGMTLQSFSAVHNLFMPLLFMALWLNVILLSTILFVMFVDF